TWQDIRSNVKRKQQGRMGEIPETIAELTDTEKEALGLKNVSSTTNYQDTMEFVAPEDESTRENPLNDYNDSASIDESESPPEVKVEVTHLKAKTHSDDCVFNCNKLAVLEQSKIQIKEDYFNFKKDYLRQKLILMKEQTEALKCIAQGLANAASSANFIQKTWQDIRSNVKRKQQGRMGEIPETIAELTDTEKEALGLKNVSSTTNYQDTMEFVAPEDESTRENPLNDYNDSASIDESESPPEVKVEVTHLKAKTHSDDCVFNCNKLAVLEQSKIQIKEDYFNFKKDYLRQKLILMKEQTEALKCIAQGLAK
ncbi:Uncharacterized protein OBRU01_25295, partial [Operophtera brumata]